MISVNTYTEEEFVSTKEEVINPVREGLGGDKEWRLLKALQRLEMIGKEEQGREAIFRDRDQANARA